MSMFVCALNRLAGRSVLHDADMRVKRNQPTSTKGWRPLNLLPEWVGMLLHALVGSSAVSSPPSSVQWNARR